MRAVLLAAGLGSRLGRAGEDWPPKCLLRPGGRTLLERHLEALRAEGVEDVSLVVGYRAELVEHELARLDLPKRPGVVRNARFEEGSVVSLWHARQVLESGEAVLLMDADVLYDPRLLRPLVRHPGDRLLIDRELEAGEEPVKVCVRAGKIVEFRKRVPAKLECDLVGESVGFFRLSHVTARRVARRTVSYLEAGRSREPYEEVLRDEMLEHPGGFGWVDVTGLPWIEIDFPEDLRRAEQEILPAIERSSAAPRKAER